MKTPCRILVPLLAGFMAISCTSPESYTEPEALARLIAEKSEPYILVDVRTPAEYDSGHIPTAINIPVTEIAEKPPTADMKALIILYCASGRRSAAAAKTLTDLGYTRVVDFGGISRWKGDLVTLVSPETNTVG